MSNSQILNEILQLGREKLSGTPPPRERGSGMPTKLKFQGLPKDDLPQIKQIDKGHKSFELKLAPQDTEDKKEEGNFFEEYELEEIQHKILQENI